MQEVTEGGGGHRGEIIITEAQRARSYGGNPKYRNPKPFPFQFLNSVSSVVNISPLCFPPPPRPLAHASARAIICRATIENRGTASNARRPAPLSQHWISGSFRVVVNLLNVFGGANRPEFRILDLYVPWIFVISLFGFLAAWLLIAILESTGLSRHIWHLPLFFLALVVLLSSIFGFVCFP
jgi:hypothetical protein